MEESLKENKGYKKALEKIVNTIDESLPVEISEYLIRFINNKLMPQLEYWNTPIEELGLQRRAYNSLKRAGISEIGNLVIKSEKELRATKGFKYGSKGLNEIKQALAKYGLSLRDEYK